jgi:lipoic acid synthetase
MSTNSRKVDPTQKSRGRDKLSRIPIKIETTTEVLRKPEWIRIKLDQSGKVNELKQLLRQNKMVTVCEEAACPNLNECFSKGTATFMIMGDKCTRRCSFCEVAHGRPDPLDPDEPKNLADSIARLNLKYIVITSVDRDDLRDGGAGHFSDCITAIREQTPQVKIEVLVPDFRGRMEKALNAMADALPDVFNHNIETVPRLYKAVRPGSDYQWSLSLLKTFKARYPGIPTKSGIMVGLGETDEEIITVMEDMRAHDIDMLTIGQYLQPSRHHAPVTRYVTPAQFEKYRELGLAMGFDNVASGPLVRSSYHADQQASGNEVS